MRRRRFSDPEKSPGAAIPTGGDESGGNLCWQATFSDP
jgi:hypothetical protein